MTIGGSALCVEIAPASNGSTYVFALNRAFQASVEGDRCSFVTTVQWRGVASPSTSTSNCTLPCSNDDGQFVQGVLFPRTHRHELGPQRRAPAAADRNAVEPAIREGSAIQITSHSVTSE